VRLAGSPLPEAVQAAQARHESGVITRAGAAASVGRPSNHRRATAGPESYQVVNGACPEPDQNREAGPAVPSSWSRRRNLQPRPKRCSADHGRDVGADPMMVRSRTKIDLRRSARDLARGADRDPLPEPNVHDSPPVGVRGLHSSSSRRQKRTDRSRPGRAYGVHRRHSSVTRVSLLYLRKQCRN